MKTGVLALAQDLANAQAAPLTLDQMYDDAMFDVAGQALFNVVEIIPTSEDQPVYARPPETTDILAVFYDDDMLSLVTLRELETVHPDWRKRRGRPVAYLIEDQSNDEFRIYPRPMTSPLPPPAVPADADLLLEGGGSVLLEGGGGDVLLDPLPAPPPPTDLLSPVIPLHGAPFGLDYPVDTLAVLASQRRTDLPDWMDLPLALAVVAREYARSSPHMDKVFAGAARQLAALFLSMAV